MKIYDHQSDLTYIFWKTSNKIGSHSLKENFKVQTLKINGKIKNSLISSINSKINETLVAYRFMNAFLLDYNLKRDIKKNARFYLIVEKKFDHDYFIKFGNVLIAALEINNKVIKKIFVPFSKNGISGGAFLSQEDFSSVKPFYSPVNTLHISSSFQARRRHPIKKRRQAHLGIDFALPSASPVYAVANGRVIKTGRARAPGNYIVIQHKNGLKSYYNHLNKVNSNISTGTFVKAGQAIGQIGCTGYCTKPHLHLAIKKNSRMVNPSKYIKGYPAHAEKQLKNSFKRISQKIKKHS